MIPEEPEESEEPIILPVLPERPEEEEEPEILLPKVTIPVQETRVEIVEVPRDPTDEEIAAYFSEY